MGFSSWTSCQDCKAEGKASSFLGKDIRGTSGRAAVIHPSVHSLQEGTHRCREFWVLKPCPVPKDPGRNVNREDMQMAYHVSS